MIHVTAHALTRALERIPGLKSEAEAMRILRSKAVDEAARFAPTGSIYVRITTGNRIVLEDGYVVTVLPVSITLHQMSSAAHRRRQVCRARSIVHFNRNH
ncbi:hypothetical protein [Novosphingobium colocasiae]|uniref:hypothetical protein n=1 Tax=Novosphingobium colocasiae TaxID=1256513 RepID=UPI0035AE64CC